MLSVPDASARILADIAPLPPERVPVLDALGRVLAQSVSAPYTLPAWNNSAMDGYAVLAADIAGASGSSPVTLPVRETVAAGAFPSAPIAPGGAERVTVRDARDARKNVRFRGEDFAEGDALLRRGTPVGAAQIGVLASV